MFVWPLMAPTKFCVAIRKTSFGVLTGAIAYCSSDVSACFFFPGSFVEYWSILVFPIFDRNIFFHRQSGRHLPRPVMTRFFSTECLGGTEKTENTWIGSKWPSMEGDWLVVWNMMGCHPSHWWFFSRWLTPPGDCFKYLLYPLVI